MNKVSAILFAVGLVAGYKYAAALYSQDIADLREDYATRSNAMEIEYRAKERKNAEALAKAWEERDRANARLDTLDNDVKRLRNEASSARQRLSKASSGSCKFEREQLARGAELIERGGELVKRSLDLSKRIALDKDAIVSIAE